MADQFDRLTAALADRYTIERELGAGGMANVYLAEDLKHKRKVAVKVLRPELAAVLGAERFVQEITTTANLQHPHILPLFDSGEADGFLYYVMPFIDGETLRDKLNRETQLGIDDAVKITTEIADALDYAHRHNVIHRDIKPENILLHDGRSMVADFGIALAVSAAAGGRMTETGLSLGTPHYMSPEQATAEKDLTARSDVYSLGCVLYELLAGEPPHMGSSAQQIIMKIVTDKPRPVNELRKSVPPNVTAAVAKSLEKLAADRFDSAKSFADALANPAFVGQAVAASVSRPAAVPWKRLSIVAMALTVALALALGWALRGSEPSPRVTVRSIIPLATPQQLPANEYGASLAVSPTGETVVFVTTDETLQWRLMRRELDQFGAVPVVPLSSRYPFFSPDGAWIGFESDGKLTKLPWAGGQPEVIYDAPEAGRRVAHASWSETGVIVFGLIGRYPLMTVTDSGGSVEPITVLDTARNEIRHRGPRMLPGGRAFLFEAIAEQGARMIAIQSLETGSRRNLLPGRSPRYASDHVVFWRDNALWVVPFDVERLDTTGAAVELAEDVPSGVYDFALGPAGTLVYAARPSAAARRRLVWVDRAGREEIATRQARSYARPRLSPDGNKVALQMGERRLGLRSEPRDTPPTDVRPWFGLLAALDT